MAEALDHLLRHKSPEHLGDLCAGAFRLHLLAQHPRVMARLRDEADGFTRPDSDIEVMRRLPFATEVASEVLRLYPPVAMMARQPKQDCVIGGYAVGAGSLVVIHPYLAQRDPTYWPNPDVFAPNQEVPLPKRLKHRGAYTPFGGGPRLCLGKQFAIHSRAMSKLQWRRSPNS